MYYHQQRCANTISPQNPLQINNPTNNGLFTKYRTKKYQFRCYDNIQPPVFLWNIKPKTPYNISSKPLEQFYTSSIIVYFQNPPPILPLGGDTPFCAFGYEIEDFYLTRKKTGRRYLRRIRIVAIVQAYVRIVPHI